MTPATLELLQQADDPVNWEQPEGWLEEYPRAMQRVRALATALREVSGRSFDLDYQIQDASFFAQLSLIEPDSTGKPECVLGLRFSCFGNLFSMVPWSSRQLPEETITRIIQLTITQGFRYVDLKSLAEPYPGVDPEFKATTWWARFFDYTFMPSRA